MIYGLSRGQRDKGVQSYTVLVTGVFWLTTILLCASVKGPCLHWPENWLIRQVNDEPRPVYKAGFISEKGKATAREE
jgi:hypothetical protein